MDVSKKRDHNKQPALIAAYQEVSKSYHAFIDSRTKLFIGFLPISSGAGALLISQWASDVSAQLLLSIAFFGFVLTLGVCAHELRWLTHTYTLIALGKKIEHELGITGHFTQRPDFAPFTKSKNTVIVIYPIVLAAWLFIGLSGFSSIWAAVAALCCFSVSLVVIQKVRSTLPKL